MKDYDENDNKKKNVTLKTFSSAMDEETNEVENEEMVILTKRLCRFVYSKKVIKGISRK